MKNNVYLCKPQFYYIKVGFKGVNIIQACFRDAYKKWEKIYQVHPFSFNLNKPNGFPHPYILGEFICHLRGVRSIYFFFVLFVIENPVSKQ